MGYRLADLDKDTKFYERTEIKPCNEAQLFLFLTSIPKSPHGLQALRIAKYDIYSASRYLELVSEGKIKIVESIFRLGSRKWKVIRDFYNPPEDLRKTRYQRKADGK